jgi:hypothetical protein
MTYFAAADPAGAAAVELLLRDADTRRAYMRRLLAECDRRIAAGHATLADAAATLRRCLDDTDRDDLKDHAP